MDFEAFVSKTVPERHFATYSDFVRGSDCFVRYPVIDPKTLKYPEDHLPDMLNAFRNAPFYTMAVLDESLPAGIEEGSRMLLDGYPFFCREMMIADLARIGYRPACPNLREAMLHDLRVGVRRAAAKALGKIGDKRYTNDLVWVMREDPKLSRTAMFALGDMRDDLALPALKEMFEEARRRFDLADHAQDGDLLWEQMEAIRDITDVMVRIGGEAGKFVENWARYEFRDWVRRPMKTGIDISYIGR